MVKTDKKNSFFWIFLLEGRSMLLAKDHFGGESHMGAEEFADLLRKARGGCREALGELLLEHESYLYWLAGELQKGDQDEPPERRSDVVQGVLLIACEQFGQFRGESAEELRGWLRSMLVSVVWRGRRRPRARTGEDLDGVPDGQPSPAAQLEAAEHKRRFHAAMAQLSEEERLIIRLGQSYKHSWQEMGIVLGKLLDISEEAARKRYTRTLRKLARLLQAAGLIGNRA